VRPDVLYEIVRYVLNDDGLLAAAGGPGRQGAQS